MTSPVCAVVIKNIEYVSIVTCTYLNVSNSAIQVTSICHKWSGSCPQGFTPRWGTGKYCEHISHCLTIGRAASLVNLNCFQFSISLIILCWWCRACDHWESSTWDKAIIFVSLAMHYFQLMDQDNLNKLWYDLQSRATFFVVWHFEFDRTAS